MFHFRTRIIHGGKSYMTYKRPCAVCLMDGLGEVDPKAGHRADHLEIRKLEVDAMAMHDGVPHLSSTNQPTNQPSQPAIHPSISQTKQKLTNKQTNQQTNKQPSKQTSKQASKTTKQNRTKQSIKQHKNKNKTNKKSPKTSKTNVKAGLLHPSTHATSDL